MREPAIETVLPVQRAVAAAWPSAWIDAIAMRADAQGIVVVTLAGDEVALAAGAHVEPGEPVAFHPVAEVLSVRGALVRARRR
ncbi:nuclease [Microbacterium album]|uniref:nuclease n=1 Tax=Microbacterium album TaxID=2053191 RepID=UPI00166AA070|nr:nuclease [Microbacterium album]